MLSMTAIPVTPQTRPALRAMFAWDSLLLLLICVADMLSTLYFVHAGMATESNPLMAYWLKMSDGAFCAAKIMSFLPLLCVAAYYRASRPKLVALALRTAIIMYVVIYVVGVSAQSGVHIPFFGR